MGADTSGLPGSTDHERHHERLGVFGGTFDPIHVAHVVVAETVRDALRLDRVLMVVAGDPWQKSGRVHAPARLRLEMTAEAVDGLPGLEASAIEVDREGPSYTSDTLSELASPTRDLFLVVGSDVAAQLDTWVRVDRVRDLATLVVVERAGDARAAAPGEGWRVERVEIPRLDVSSTDVRRRVAEGRPIDHLVPTGAVRIIRAHALYTRSDDARGRSAEG